MPLRPAMARLLHARRLHEHLDALNTVEQARLARDEANAQSRLYGERPLEGKAAPVHPPNRKRAA